MCQKCLGWTLDPLTLSSYSQTFEYPHRMDTETPGVHLFHGPGRLPSSLLLKAWNHCIDMFVIRREWLEGDVKKYLHQLCINDATIIKFDESCRNNVYLQEVLTKRDEYKRQFSSSSSNGQQKIGTLGTFGIHS
jgi:hypothetical protein